MAKRECKAINQQGPNAGKKCGNTAMLFQDYCKTHHPKERKNGQTSNP